MAEQKINPLNLIQMLNATVQYLGGSFPWLASYGGPCLLLLFGWINLAGVATLARWIDSLTIWKLLVPLAVSIALIFGAGHWGNLQVAGYQQKGILDALSTGGILFSLLGFRTGAYIEGKVPDGLQVFVTGQGKAQIAASFSGVKVWSTRSTICSMIGPSSRSAVT